MMSLFTPATTRLAENLTPLPNARGQPRPAAQNTALRSAPTRRHMLRLGLSLSPFLLLAACSPRAASPRVSAVEPSSAALAAASSPTALALGAAPTSSAAAPACVMTPEETEGPYFVDEKLNRSDLRSDALTGAVTPGLPLNLTFRVVQVAASGCTRLIGASLDVWHCDALGSYSDVSGGGAGTRGQNWLRGYQLTDASGAARFTTIYPGWYQGRAVHLHFKVRSNPLAASGPSFTSQLYFDDALTDQVHAQPPYAARGKRTVRNSADGIFQSGGDQLVLQLRPEGQGLSGTFDVGLKVL